MKFITLGIMALSMTLSTRTMAGQTVTGLLLHLGDYPLSGYELLVYNGSEVAEIYDLQLEGNTCAKSLAADRLASYLNALVTLSFDYSDLSPGQTDPYGVPHENLAVGRNTSISPV